jgi:hypothetical protein
MGTTGGSAAPEFHGSISRRLTILSVLFLVLVAIVGGLSVHSALRIDTLHDESEELDEHIQALERVAGLVAQLRAEAQVALFLGQGFDDPTFREIPGQIRDQWERFERMHDRGGTPWGGAPAEERILSLEVKEALDRFLDFTTSVITARPSGYLARRQVAATLHAQAQRLEEALGRLGSLHHAFIADRTRAAKAEI